LVELLRLVNANGVPSQKEFQNEKGPIERKLKIKGIREKATRFHWSLPS